MLSAHEFTAGTLANAAPLSLILPRTKYEATILIGAVEEKPTAIFLSGQYAFLSFASADNEAWKGLIVPNVQVEVDETTSFDPDREGVAAGVLVRSDTRLIALGKSEGAFGQSIAVTLYANLPPAHGARVAFSKWQVVIGAGEAKRILTKIDVRRPAEG